MNNEKKKKKNFGCSRVEIILQYVVLWSWALAGAGRAWLGELRAVGAGRACVLGVPGSRGRRA